MLKVLGLSLYGPLAASHRVRLAQYYEGLKKEGIHLQIQSLLGDDYIKHRFETNKRSALLIFKAGLERVRFLLVNNHFDLAIVHCELLPFIPGWGERALLRIPYIYDIDDAFYLRYKSAATSWLWPFVSNKFENVIRQASAVTAGNETLAAYTKRFNDSVLILPSVVDTIKFSPNRRSKNSTFTIGWLGSPSTAAYLGSLVIPLQTLGILGPLRLIVIGGKAPPIKNVAVQEIPWSEEREVELINTFDVGIMPLTNDEWSRGKSAFKLVQYMACGVPVVASRVGANIELVTEECGFLVNTAEQWVDAIRQLWEQPLLRESMGASSRRRVVTHYSLNRNLPLLSAIIQDMASRNKRNVKSHEKS